MSESSSVARRLIDRAGAERLAMLRSMTPEQLDRRAAAVENSKAAGR